jgi:putative peptide zinc metalloprotease protein
VALASVRALLSVRGKSVIAKPPFPPRLADGVELLGEFKDSGYTNPPSLVRRGDGQVIQLSRLLYLVARQMDGRRGPVGIADLVSGDLGRSLSPGQVCYLIVAKLAPLGIVAGQRTNGPPPAASPLLSLRARGTLLPARAASAVGSFLRPLFHWPVIAAVIAAVTGTDTWVFAVHGLGGAFGQILSNPADLLLLALLTVASAAFHECGHAAACRYGGARPGRIGFGIYLVWPSFFTDVTDSYRLSRAGRLRTDLGGIYFNLIFILLLAGLYAATSAQLLLLVIAITHLEMLEQLMPLVRFDGYFILSDLVGVPDLFARIVPVLRGRSSGHQQDRHTGLRRQAQLVATCWVLCVVPLLLVTLGYLLLHLPAANRALWLSASHSAGQLLSSVTDRRYAAAAVNAIGAGLALLSVAGSLYIAAGLTRRAVAAGLNWSAGRRGRRLAAAAAGAGAAAGLLAYWVAQGQLRGW